MLPAVHHVVLTVSNVEGSRKFYSELLGEELKMENDGLFMIGAGNTKVFFAPPPKRALKNDCFNENRIGLDHLAFQVSSIKELEKILVKLKKLGAKTEGIEINKYSKREYICFRDPDNIQVEFYLR